MKGGKEGRKTKLWQQQHKLILGQVLLLARSGLAPSALSWDTTTTNGTPTMALGSAERESYGSTSTHLELADDDKRMMMMMILCRFHCSSSSTCK